MIICVAEDRPENEPGLQVLISSLSSTNSKTNVVLFLPQTDGCLSFVVKAVFAGRAERTEGAGILWMERQATCSANGA